MKDLKATANTHTPDQAESLNHSPPAKRAGSATEYSYLLNFQRGFALTFIYLSYSIHLQYALVRNHLYHLGTTIFARAFRQVAARARTACGPALVLIVDFEGDA